MPVTATDLIFYLSENRPENDNSMSGGEIDKTVRLMPRDAWDLGGPSGDKIDLVSTSAVDTQSCVLAGYGPDGSWLVETVDLNGTSHTQSTRTYVHLLKCVMATPASGVVTVSRYNNDSPISIMNISNGECGSQALFLKATAETEDGNTKYFYEKIFIANNNTANALVDGIVWLQEDEDNELTIDLEMINNVTILDGSEAVANRLTAPTTGGTYNFGEHATQSTGHRIGDNEDGNLPPNSAQGIWVKLTLAAGRTPERQVDWAPAIVGAAT